MAKAKAARRKANESSKAPGKAGGKSLSLTIRASEAWRDWLEQAADHCRTNVSGFLDQAAAEFAKARGFTAPPPKR